MIEQWLKRIISLFEILHEGGLQNVMINKQFIFL